MKTSKALYSQNMGGINLQAKDGVNNQSSPTSRSPSPRSGPSGIRVSQNPINFKAGDMSVATNDLKGTPNGIMRLQDVKFSSSHVKIPVSGMENSSKVASGSNSAYKRTENTSQGNQVSAGPIQTEFMSDQPFSNQVTSDHPQTNQLEGSGVERTERALQNYNDKQSSLKARFQGFPLQGSPHANHLATQEQTTFTKQQIKELKALNKNREIFQMMGRTQTTDIKQYTRFGAKANARGRKGSQQGSRSGSRGLKNQSVNSQSSKGLKFGETIRSTNGRMSQNSSSLLNSQRGKRNFSKDKQMKGKYNMYYSNNADAISGISKHSKMEGLGGISSGEEDDALNNMILNVEVKTSQTHRRNHTNLRSTTRSNNSQSPRAQDKLFKIRKQSKSRLSKNVQRQGHSPNQRIQSASWKVDKQLNINTQGGNNEQNANNRDLDFTSMGLSTARNMDSRIKLAPIQHEKNLKIGPSTTKHAQSYSSMDGLQSNFKNKLNQNNEQARTSVPSAMNFNKQLNEKSSTTINMKTSNEDQQAQEIMKKYAGLGGQLYIDKSNTHRDKPKSKPKVHPLFAPSQQSSTHRKIPSIELNKEDSEPSGRISKAVSQTSTALHKGAAAFDKISGIKNLKLNTDSSKEFGGLKNMQLQSESDAKSREPGSGNKLYSAAKESEQPKNNIQLSDFSSEKGIEQFVDIQPLTSPQSVHFLASEMPETVGGSTHRRLKSRGQSSLKKLSKISKKAKQVYEAEPNSNGKSKAQKNNQLNSQSVYMKPGQQFSQPDHVPPSKIIDGIKKQIELMQKDNKQFTTMIESNDNKFNTQTKNIAETKKKSAQAKSDKKELFRDLATYESKFNEKSSLQYRMEQILIKAQKTKTIINKNINLEDIDIDCDGDDYRKIDKIIDKELKNSNLIDQISIPVPESKRMIGMLSDAQINQIHSNLRDLKNVRRNRALTSSTTLELAGIADKLNIPGMSSAAGIGAPKGLQLLSSRAKKISARKLTVQSQSQILTIAPSAQEECNIQITISGLRAVVQARFQNGMIKGLISGLIFTKGLKFDMPPTETMKTHIDVLQEIKRLYFGLKKSKFGKNQMQLQFKESIEDAEKIKSYMVKIRGANSKQVNIDIIKQAQGRNGYKVSLKLKDQVLTEEISEKELMKYKQSQIKLERQIAQNSSVQEGNQSNNQLIANLLEKHYVIIHRITGNQKYEFLHEDLAQKIYKQDAEIIHKKVKSKTSIYQQSKKTSLAQTPLNARDTVSPYFNLKGEELDSQQSISQKGSTFKQASEQYHKQRIQTNSEKINELKQSIIKDNHLEAFFPDLANIVSQYFEKEQEAPNDSSQESQEAFKDNLRAFQQQIQNKSVKQLQSLNQKRGSSAKDRRPKPIIEIDTPEELAPLEIVCNNKIMNRVVAQDYFACDFSEKHKWTLHFKSYLMRLKLQKRKQEEKQIIKQANDQIEFYDMFYGPRQLRSRKKFEQYKLFKEKQKALEEQKEEDMVEIIQDFFDDLNMKPQMKDRITESKNKTTKRKYIRQPKIYQNDYIDDLKDSFPDYMEFKEVDEVICSPDYTVHFLFLKEKREYFLMLGRSDTPASSNQSSVISGDSYQSSEGSYEISSNELNSNEDKDDDSPYFVKITLDQMFLQYLEDPELFTGQDVQGNYQLILDNKIFKEIVKSEFEIMFGGDSKKKTCDDHHHDDEDNLLENKSLSAESNSLSSEESLSQDQSKEPPSLKAKKDLQKGTIPSQSLESPFLEGSKDHSHTSPSISIASPTSPEVASVSGIAQGQPAAQQKDSLEKVGLIAGTKNESKKPIHLEQKLQGMVTNFSWILNFK